MGRVLKGLMAEWGAQSAKQKVQQGKTKQQRMIDDNIPGDPSSKDVRKKMDDGRKSGAAQGASLQGSAAIAPRAAVPPLRLRARHDAA